MKIRLSTYLYIVLALAIHHTITAQNEAIYNLQSNLIKVETDYLDVKIESWDQNFIDVTSEVKINLMEGKENHELQVQNSINGIVIKSFLDTEGIDQMIITTDKAGNKTYTPKSEWDESNEKSHFNSLNIGYEIDGVLTIYVPKKMWLEVKTLYGDTSLNGEYQQLESCSTYGMIEAKLADVSEMRKVSLNSTYDIVDLTIDKKSNATLKLNTTYGSVFSDLPMNIKGATSSKKGCSNFAEKYVLNDGSVDIHIMATYDNIYVRSN